MMDKNKANLPKIRFPGFTEEWERLKLRNGSYKIGDGLHGTPNYSEKGNVFFINGNNIADGNIVFVEGTKRVTEREKSEDDKLLNENTILMSINGTIGNLALYQGENIMLGKSAAYITVKDFDRYFIYSYLQTKSILSYFMNSLTGTTIKNLSLKAIRETEIFVPSLSEQQKIGDFFSCFDSLIRLHELKLNYLQLKKKGLLRKMFPQKGERFPEFRFPGFAEEWERRKLGEFGSTYTGLSGKSKDDFGHGRGKYVTYMNVYSNSIADLLQTEVIEIDRKQNEVKRGDIFFTTSSETPDEVGMSSVWLDNGSNTYLNSFCFGYRPSIRFDNYYMAYMLRSDSIRKQMKLLAQGISRYNISKNKVMEIEAPYPSNLTEGIIRVNLYPKGV